MNMKQKSTILFVLTALISSQGLFAAETNKVQEMTLTTAEREAAIEAAIAAKFKQGTPTIFKDKETFDWGGDVRLREIYLDNIPTQNGGEVRGGANNFQRYRTRVWGEYRPSNSLFVRARLVNEWRTGQAGRSADGWKAFDETVFDNLFINWENDLWNIRLGRQDMIYGTGKLILDGTPLDGSRTIYFDAAKAVYKGIDNTTVDFFAMYTQAQDPLALHSQDRDLVGRGGSNYDGAEAGGGVYVKNKTYENLPWEAYFISKTKEDDINSPRTAATSISDPINTVGTRLMPKWGEGTFDANLEMAYQSMPNVDGIMIDALVSWNIESMKEEKAKLGLGWYHLSEDWNPIFSRWPQYSELYVYAQSGAAGRWSNVSMPHIDFSISPTKNYKADLLLGYMFAPKANGQGDGHDRGFLFTWWNRFTLKEGLISSTDKLTGHFLIELMDAGNYYNSAQRENISIFTRLELTYAF